VNASTDAKFTTDAPRDERGRAAAITFSTPRTLMSKMRR
jgi:hypothetical protein